MSLTFDLPVMMVTACGNDGGRLPTSKGIGPETAAVLWSEGLFRQFDNRRQLAAYAGLAPTPWQSGSIDLEQGVSKAGNPRLRMAMAELAWLSEPASLGAQPVVP